MKSVKSILHSEERKNLKRERETKAILKVTSTQTFKRTSVSREIVNKMVRASKSAKTQKENQQDQNQNSQPKNSNTV